MTSSYLESSRMLNISIEEKLLLCCARTNVDYEIYQQIKQLIQQKIDWDELIKLAIYHQVTPLLYRNLAQLNDQLIPAGALGQLRDLNFTNTVISMSLSSKLLEILSWFSAAGIQVIPYKGAVLAAAGYGDICLRQFNDLDLLVAPPDVAKSENLLMAHGYELHDQYGWEETFIHPEQGVNIDLHHGMGQSYYPFRLDFDDCIQRCQSVVLLDQSISSFSTADLLLVLSLQLVKDSHDETCVLAKVCDMAELVPRCSAPEWEKAIELSQAIGCQRLLSIGLLLTHELLGTPLPPAIWQLIEKDWIVHQYGKLLASIFFQPVKIGRSLFWFKVWRGLVLIEYPLSAPSNAHLLNTYLTSKAKYLKRLLFRSAQYSGNQN
jgi:Uncharacterised nucleotidyltransferase